MKYSKRSLLSTASSIALTASIGLPRLGLADIFPSKPIRLLIGFSAGSSTDTVARLVAQKLQDTLGQPIVIDNKPGAGGNLAADLVAKANPDGYTLLFCNNGLAISASLYAKLPYNPLKDLEPVTQVTSMPHVMLANSNLPVNTVKELIALAKASPGTYNFGSAGAGNSDHMAGALFNVLAGTDIVHVPYRGGPQAMADVIAGNVALYYSGLPGALPMIKAGRVKALGVSSTRPVPALPGVPPIADTVPGYEVNLWYGIVAPAGTPKAVVDKLASEIAKVLDQPDMKEKFATLGVDRAATSPAQFKTFFQSEVDKWAKVVKSTGITAN